MKRSPSSSNVDVVTIPPLPEDEGDDIHFPKRKSIRTRSPSQHTPPTPVQGEQVMKMKEKNSKRKILPNGSDPSLKGPPKKSTSQISKKVSFLLTPTVVSIKNSPNSSSAKTSLLRTNSTQFTAKSSSKRPKSNVPPKVPRSKGSSKVETKPPEDERPILAIPYEDVLTMAPDFALRLYKYHCNSKSKPTYFCSLCLQGKCRFVSKNSYDARRHMINFHHETQRAKALLLIEVLDEKTSKVNSDEKIDTSSIKIKMW